MSAIPPSGDDFDPPDANLPEETASNFGRKKGAKKKVKRIRGTGASGPPTKLSTPVKRMSSSRKRKYNREKQAENRDQIKTPTKRETPLSPDSKKKREEELKRKNEISEIRKQAAAKRWAMVDTESSSSSDHFSFDEDGEIIEHDKSQDMRTIEANSMPSGTLEDLRWYFTPS